MRTFEITIARSIGQAWPVVVEMAADDGSLPIRRDGNLTLDLTALLALEVDRRAYGRALGEALFRDAIDDAFAAARASGSDEVRVLLNVEAPDLRTLRWERLMAPLGGTWQFLALDQRVPFSLYLPSSTDQRFPPIGRRDLRALVVVASPEASGSTGLPPFDAVATIAGVRRALGEIPTDVLAAGDGFAGPPTLDALCELITDQSYTILHIVCHGRVLRDGPNIGETVLYLGTATGGVAPVSGSHFLERLGQIGGARGLPHLAFLCACETARAVAEGALGGLAQRMVRELGIPAVVAMSDQISIATAEALASRFYVRLRESGEVDRALVEAYAGLADAPDVTVPALYSRLGGRPLFSDASDRPTIGSRFARVMTPTRWLVSTVAAALVGTIAVAGAVAVMDIAKGPPRMTGEFNVVVTELTERDAAGRAFDSDRARMLSTNLYDQLAAGLADLRPALNVQVLRPGDVGRLGGSSPEDRFREAQRLADLTNANMVIFGSLDSEGDTLTPEFYVAPSALPGAEELTGTFALGTPIRSAAEAGSLASDVELRRVLQSRATALASFVAGLTFFANERFSEAATKFDDALVTEGWDDRDGKEVLYLFRGTTAALQDDLVAARAFYERALALNPEYGRALIGAAQVALHMASGTCSAESIDATGVMAARQMFRQAMSARDQPPHANVPAKAHFGIGRADVCLTQAQVEDDWADAGRELDAVIAEYEAGNQAIRDLTAEAHAERAVVRLPGAGDPASDIAYRAAADEYRAAIALSEHDDRRAYFYDSLGWVLEQLGDIDGARAAYDQAIALAPDEAYREHRARLEAPPTASPAPGGSPSPKTSA